MTSSEGRRPFGAVLHFNFRIDFSHDGSTVNIVKSIIIISTTVIIISRNNSQRTFYVATVGPTTARSTTSQSCEKESCDFHSNDQELSNSCQL